MQKHQYASTSEIFILFLPNFTNTTNIEHIVFTNRIFFVFGIATFWGGKLRHKRGAKKLKISYW